MSDLGCTIKRLPSHVQIDAARTAVSINPTNMPRLGLFGDMDNPPLKEEIAFLASTWWGTGGVDLTVEFLDTTDAALKARILSHANAWNKLANVRFREVASGGQVRIARVTGDGYWSYLGTDILHVNSSEPTMNLDSFDMDVDEAEYKRVVRHEFGHCLGSPHEHMRAEIVARLDVNKTIKYFHLTQGWSASEVKAQVLTPISDADLLIGTPDAEEDSIMCYQLPGSITKDGKPIAGGIDITADDYGMMGLVYPKAVPA